MITASVMKGLTEHQLEYSFLDTFDPICNCGFDIETLNLFYLHFSRFANERQNPLHEIESIAPDILKKNSRSITSIHLYGDPSSLAELTLPYSTFSFVYLFIYFALK